MERPFRPAPGLPDRPRKRNAGPARASTVEHRSLETTPRGLRRWLPPPRRSAHRRRLTGGAIRSDGLPRPLRLRVEVRLDHPEPFVHASRDLDEDVVGILVLVAVLDGAANELAESRQRRGEGLDVLPPGRDLQGVFGERRSLCNRTRRAFDRPAELDRLGRCDSPYSTRRQRWRRPAAFS